MHIVTQCHTVKHAYHSTRPAASLATEATISAAAIQNSQQHCTEQQTAHTEKHRAQHRTQRAASPATEATMSAAMPYSRQLLATLAACQALLRDAQRCVGAWMLSCLARCARHRLQDRQQQKNQQR
jgi:hypothetical protein